MTSAEFSQAIKARLHPEPYKRDIQPCDALDFLIVRRSVLFIWRYAFALRQIGPDGVAETYRRARAEARRLPKSMWLFHQVGLYLMLCGPESSWRNHTADGPADRTGLHNIIVQAVHFVDLETGAHHLNQSAWGPVKFGGLIPIPEMVGEIIKRIPTE